MDLGTSIMMSVMFICWAAVMIAIIKNR